MPRNTNTRILKDNLILCEGRDEQEFLIKYLNSSALSDIAGFSNDFQVIDFGGNSELIQKLAILKNMDNFENVKSLMIIRDAETNAAAACHELQLALQKTDYPVPEKPHCWKGQAPKVGFILFPTCDHLVQNGTLEDLCLSILADPSASDTLDGINTFLKQLEIRRQKPFGKIFKTKLHTYFSVQDEYVSLKIGEAAAAGAFDWNNAALYPLKSFLQEVL
ncbi:MAG: hypothetical protein HFH85_01450 [Lachnospiraceae bacterium]|jgi:hypothetical protein|nr:hypothetical protein [Lachnospiraceae bacterium]